MNNVDTIAFGAFNIASWYDGDGGELYGSKALHNTFQNEPLYKLRNTGTMFQQIIINPESNRNCSPLK